MTNERDPLQLATRYHTALPGRIRSYLNARGIPDVLINFHLLGWNGWRITIPIFNWEAQLAFFKLARDPEDRLPGPKMMASPGGYAELYGWEQVRRKPSQIVICEGEFDRLVLEAHGFAAVTSTAGAGVFRRSWAEAIAAIPEVYVCFDNDEAGRNGAAWVGQLIPHTKIVELPEEVGSGGDVTDFFVRLSRSRKDFEQLLQQAMPAPPAPPRLASSCAGRATTLDPLLRERINRIKRELSIARIIGEHVKLQKAGNNLMGLCPFHEDHNPSLAVYPARGTFHCFGCRSRGDVITFVQQMEQLSFAETLRALEERLPRQHGPSQ